MCVCVCVCVCEMRSEWSWWTRREGRPDEVVRGMSYRSREGELYEKGNE